MRRYHRIHPSCGCPEVSYENVRFRGSVSRPRKHLLACSVSRIGFIVQDLIAPFGYLLVAAASRSVQICTMLLEAIAAMLSIQKLDAMAPMGRKRICVTLGGAEFTSGVSESLEQFRILGLHVLLPRR
jgi:energy-converting hydrogenase Eha subunit C